MTALLLTMTALFQGAFGGIELQSIEIVPCHNENFCSNDGKNLNLRIVLNASSFDTTDDGPGTVTGTITGGQSWSDDNGDWELLHSLVISVDYKIASWEYELEEQGTFWTKTEEICMPALTSCDEFDNAVSCPEKNDMGLALKDATEHTKYAIRSFNTWEALVSIESTHLTSVWTASNKAPSTEEANAEIALSSSFDTSSCFQDLSNQYFVIVPTTGYEKYYFISKDYWQGAVNNFNFSVDTWMASFNCDFAWEGWHVIVPFYETDAEYMTLCGGDDCRIAMSSNQMYAWSNGFINSFYDDIMGIFTNGECADQTIFTDVIIERMGPPQDNTYVVSKDDIIDYFEMTLDLDYTQYVGSTSSETAESE